MKMEKKGRIEVPVSQEIIFHVLKELPAKSLLRFRSVSKQWQSIIDDPHFVYSHHTRSYTRPEGVKLLVGVQNHCHRSEIFFADQEGGSSVRLLTTPEYDCNNYESLHSVNGLVCISNRVWNPCTRETMDLPLITFTCHVGRGHHSWYFDPEYLLGFDSSTDTYKVLNICRKYYKIKNKDSESRKAVSEYKVLTLGNNSSWRNIDFVQNSRKHPLRSFVKTLDTCQSCFVDNAIYCLGSISAENVILAFEVGLEKFRIIALPDNGRFTFYIIGLGDRLALIDRGSEKMWILEDYEKQLWKRERLVIPGRWRKNDSDSIYITPIGSIGRSKIVFKSFRSFYFYYDIESESVNKLPELAKFPTGDSMSLAKHVESLFRLKPKPSN